MQREGQKREPTGVLGWDAALEMYRPLLSYDELSGILEGKPSEFYDQLYRLLGLEQLSAAIRELDAQVQWLKRPDAEIKKVPPTHSSPSWPPTRIPAQRPRLVPGHQEETGS